MSFWKTLSPHSQALWKWAAHEQAKQNAPPPTPAQQIWPGLRSENRAARVEQPKRNESVARAIYPHLRGNQQ
jgi:hypothetical protein